MREGRDGELRNLPERRMKEGMYICLIVNLAVTFWPSVVLHLCTNWWSDCRPCPEESLEVNIWMFRLHSNLREKSFRKTLMSECELLPSGQIQRNVSLTWGGAALRASLGGKIYWSLNHRSTPQQLSFSVQWKRSQSWCLTSLHLWHVWLLIPGILFSASWMYRIKCPLVPLWSMTVTERHDPKVLF